MSGGTLTPDRRCGTVGHMHTNQQVLTNTKRRDFLWCPRYFYHRHEQRLELVAKSRGRRRGTIFGDALQAARDAMAENDLPGMYQAAHSVIESAYADLVEDVNSQGEHDSLEVERAKIEVMVAAYISRYGLAARREVEFDLPLRNPFSGSPSRAFRRGGKLDGLEVIGTHRARIVEDKFVQQIQKAMIDRLPLDMQSSEYVDALADRGWDAEVAFRHTRYPGVSPTKEKIPPALTPGGKESKAKYVPAETIAEFGARLEKDVGERPEHYFDEQIVLFPKQHLESYRKGRYGVAKMILHARSLEREFDWEMAYPQNPSRCAEYGGCAFLPLCLGREGAMDRYKVVQDNVELTGGEDGE